MKDLKFTLTLIAACLAAPLGILIALAIYRIVWVMAH